MITVTVDRKLGTRHPKHKSIIYKVNYGYVKGIIAPDNEEQDAYVLGVYEPIDSFEGELIAIIKRHNDIEDKWVVANKDFTVKEIRELTHFQEQYFDIEIIKVNNKEDQNEI